MLEQPILNRLRSRTPLQKVLLLVLLVRLVALQFMAPYTILSDSASYINFPFEELLALQLNGRTPVYPAFIRVCYVLFGEANFYPAIVLVQSTLSIVAVAFFYKTLCLMVQNKTVCFWVAVFYGACPSIYGWDSCLLTESLALSGTVVFLYCMMRYIKTPRFSFGAASVVLMFVLTFLRPTFLLFDGLLLAFWVGRWIFCKQERMLAVRLFLTSCAVFVVIVGYACLFQTRFGYFSISDPMPRQSLIINIERNYYQQSSNKAYHDAVLAGLEANYWDPWTTAGDVLEQFTEVEIIEITGEYIAENRLGYFADTFAQAGSLAEEKFKNYYDYDHNAWAIPLLPFYQTYEIIAAVFRVGHMYLFMFAELVVAVVLWVKRKQPPWVHLGVAAFLFGIVVSTIMATCDEYPRTMLCALPFAYFSMASFLNWACQRATAKLLGE